MNPAIPWRSINRTPLVAGILVSMACAQPATRPETSTATSDDQSFEATCLIKINFDPQVLPLDGRSIQFLFTSTGVAREAVNTVLGSDSSSVEVKFEPLSMSGGSSASLLLNGLSGGSGTTRTITSAVPARKKPAPPGNAPLADPSMSPPGNEEHPDEDALMLFTAEADPASRNLQLYMSPVGGQEHIVLGRLTVSSTQAQARKIMTLITSRFEETLVSAARAEIARFDVAQETAAQQVDRARKQMMELQRQRRELLSASGISDLSRESILDMSRTLEKERQEIAVRSQAQKARQLAMVERVKTVGDQTKASAAEMEMRTRVAQEEMTALRNELQELQERASKERPKPEILDKMTRLKDTLENSEKSFAARSAQMEMEMATKKRLEALNEQLSSLSVDMTEGEVHLKVLDDSCRQMRDLLTRADEYELQVGIELPLARTAYENARRRQEELRLRQEAFHPPTVTVLGG